MKPSIELIEALRRAATRIEDPNGGYDWQRSKRCNCGILYNELLGRDAPSWVGPWRIAAAVDHNFPNEFCEVAGRRVDDVVTELMGCGISRIDIACVERCGDAVVLGRMGLDVAGNYSNASNATERDGRYDEPAFVARYFRAQADILEAELTNLRQTPVQDAEPLNHPAEVQGEDCGRPNSECKSRDGSPSQPVACVHMWCGGQCLYCCALEPVKQKELV